MPRVTFADESQTAECAAGRTLLACALELVDEQDLLLLKFGLLCIKADLSRVLRDSGTHLGKAITDIKHHQCLQRCLVGMGMPKRMR